MPNPCPDSPEQQAERDWLEMEAEAHEQAERDQAERLGLTTPGDLRNLPGWY